MSANNEPWSGSFVADALSVHILSDPAGAIPVEDLVGLALRRNPKRAHLLVSTVLAKHVPTEPALVMAAGELLGAFVAKSLAEAGLLPQGLPADDAGAHATLLAEAVASLRLALRTTGADRARAIASLAAQVAALRTTVPDAVVLGYAETATGLGRLVANALGSYYVHSTRHATPGMSLAAGFEEGHSHATSHRLVPSDPNWLARRGPVILVDDELSTGSTVINTIRELHALVPHEAYVVAALIDLRSGADRERFAALANELGCRILVAALGTGKIGLEHDILTRAAELIASLPEVPATEPTNGRLSLLELTDADLKPVRSDRFGTLTAPEETDIAVIARELDALLRGQSCAGPLVVLGTEENMFLPLAVAAHLELLRPDLAVRFSTTTRSPIVPVDRPDYAIAGALTFASHDLTADGPGVRFAYNLSGATQRPGTIVVFPEPGTDRRAVLWGDSELGLPSLTAALRTAANDVVVVLVPADSPATTTSEDATS